VNTVVWVGWTVAILLPFAPFSYLQPIMVGGGVGTWFLLGYLLFPTVAIVGSAGISSLVFVIEAHERRRLHYGIMLTGFILLYGGALAGCFLLGIAGASGGYALVIQQSTVNAAQNLLSPYVNPITAASSIAVVGTGFTIYGMATAKATER
jgi:membrane-bound ClpP family serine protease